MFGDDDYFMVIAERMLEIKELEEYLLENDLTPADVLSWLIENSLVVIPEYVNKQKL